MRLRWVSEGGVRAVLAGGGVEDVVGWLHSANSSDVLLR